MLPVVMGARPSDYAKVSPPHSYIHVDEFAGPKELADYLHYLSTNNTKYDEYFKWKKTLLITEYKNNGQFWCRLCTILNYQVTIIISKYCDFDYFVVAACTRRKK